MSISYMFTITKLFRALTVRFLSGLIWGITQLSMLPYAYEKLSEDSEGTSQVCIQANPKRTEDDLRRLASTEGKVRPVNGAYDEPAAIAY